MTGKNWRLHWFWPVCLKYITAPAVGMVYTFVYPKFMDPENGFMTNPIYIYGFALMHLPLVFIISNAMFPKFFNFLIPAIRREDGKYDVEPMVTIGQTLMVRGGLEDGQHIDGVNRQNGEHQNHLDSDADNSATKQTGITGNEKVF